MRVVRVLQAEHFPGSCLSPSVKNDSKTTTGKREERPISHAATTNDNNGNGNGGVAFTPSVGSRLNRRLRRRSSFSFPLPVSLSLSLSLSLYFAAERASALSAAAPSPATDADDVRKGREPTRSTSNTKPMSKSDIPGKKLRLLACLVVNIRGK